MPILKLDKHGRVYDPNMGSHAGCTPLAQKSDVYDLSDEPNMRELLERKKADQISQKEFVAGVQARAIAAAKEKARLDALEWARGKREQAILMQEARLKSKDSEVLLKATTRPEGKIGKWGGVTGDPLESGFVETGDADFRVYESVATRRSPNNSDVRTLERPVVDFEQYVSDEKFGGK